MHGSPVAGSRLTWESCSCAAALSACCVGSPPAAAAEGGGTDDDRPDGSAPYIRTTKCLTGLETPTRCCADRFRGSMPTLKLHTLWHAQAYIS